MLLFTFISLVYSAANLKNFGSFSQSVNPEDLIIIVPDAGLYPITFGAGNAGELSPQRFLVRTNNSTLTLGAILFDCYCGGDQLAGRNFINSPPGGFFLYALQRCQKATPACQGYLDSPRECAEYAWNSLNPYNPSTELFCSGSAWIYRENAEVGIEIEVANTFFGGGTAFLWVFTVSNPQDYPVFGPPIPACVNQESMNPLENCYLEVLDLQSESLE